MWKNEYKGAVEKISATDAWKQQTISAMQAAQSEKKQVVFSKKKIISLAVAACFCLAIIPAGMMLLQPKDNFSAATNAATAAGQIGDAAMPAAAPAMNTGEIAAQGTTEQPGIVPKVGAAVQEAADAALLQESAPQERTIWQQGEPWQETVSLYAQGADGTQSVLTATPATPQAAEAQLALAPNETVKSACLLAVYAQGENGGMQEQLLYRFIVQNTETNTETTIDISLN